ncbi:MAG TPA: alpha/beta fold hydrolase [Nocardioidaceae bacterium]|nr:alpha/beta fold hydrolase [Nocardioidaceae bacterium]
MPVQISLIGPFRVSVDDRPVPDASWVRKDAAGLVKVLALSSARRLHREQVVDLLWPDLTLDEAAPRLHKAAHYARRATGRADAIVLRHEMVSLFPDEAVEVDVPAFEAAAASALAEGSPAAAEKVLEAFAGEPLPDDLYAEWAGEVRERCAALRSRLVDLARAPSYERGRLEQQIRFCRTRDGVTLAYATSGTGPPLVKAANWLTHIDHDWRSPVWRHWLLELSRRHRLVRYDERGCGLSDWDVESADFESWVTDLETVVDEAGLDRFPLLGISQGAAVAVVYAARHPGRVTRMVLYGSYPQGRLVRARDEADRRVHEVQVELARLGWGTDSPAFRQVFTSEFMPEGSRELWDAFNELQRSSTSPENAARVLSVTGGVDVTAEARQVRAPTLVLHARGDQRPPFEQGRLMASLIPDSRFVALESVNHILLADEPAWQVFLGEVETFLAEDCD